MILFLDIYLETQIFPKYFLIFKALISFSNIAFYYAAYDASMKLKMEQVKALESIYNGNDTLVILPTGFGKSVIFHLLPKLMSCKTSSQSIIIVLLPISALMMDQINILKKHGIKACGLEMSGALKDLQEDDDDDADDEVEEMIDAMSLNEDNTDDGAVERGELEILFGHPESFLSSDKGIYLNKYMLHTYLAEEKNVFTIIGFVSLGLYIKKN